MFSQAVKGKEVKDVASRVGFTDHNGKALELTHHCLGE